ncbi:hypothetical protein NM688_g6045 [Phlebia brevispora]|uniref:Uncharacterized protein n=1 Tax=Phlebia brevispora TaxID=194682 RepID=A0ACC1SKJ2_9APHY|nr:hypothetical protein NM688_g6045 [Phlebia brevispora]
MTAFVLGTYLWYFILSLQNVEFKLIRRRLKFTWTLIPYLLGRWAHIVTLIMLLILLRLNIEAGVCQDGDIMRTLAVLANLALVSASANLLTRAVVLWRDSKRITALLGFLAIVHWGFCIGVGISGFRPEWDPVHMVCIVDFKTARVGLFGFYIYTVLFDLIILVLTVVALRKAHDARPYKLWSVLLTQGVAYLFITCITNIPMTIMIWMDLNYTMSMFFIIPGNTVSVIASSKAVTALLQIKEDDGDSPQHTSHPTGSWMSDNDNEDIPTSGILTTNIELGTQYGGLILKKSRQPWLLTLEKLSMRKAVSTSLTLFALSRLGTNVSINESAGCPPDSLATMVNWHDPATVELCGFILAQVSALVLGAFIWYFLTTLPHAEINLILKRVRFKLAHIPYFTARYLQLLSLILLCVGTHKQTPITACSGANFYRALSVFGDVALAAASANLGFRAMVIWKDNIYVVGTISMVTFAHFVYAIAIGIAGVKIEHDPIHHTCSIVMTDATSQLLILYVFTFMWDVAVVILTVAGLWHQGICRKSPLTSLLFAQGISYALVSCMASIPVMVVLRMDLNAPMNILLLPPSSTVNVIVSCAYVASLLDVAGSPTEGLCAYDEDQISEKEKSSATFLTSCIDTPAPVSLETTSATNTIAPRA